MNLEKRIEEEVAQKEEAIRQKEEAEEQNRILKKQLEQATNKN